MPRPNLQAERKAQILSAMGSCVARYGLWGATLEKVAEEAGLARALLRHNIGNRETLIEEFIDHYLYENQKSSAEFFQALPANNQTQTLIALLFDPEFSDPESVLIAEALIAAGADDQALNKRMKNWTMDFVNRVEKVLLHDFPNSDESHLKSVAAGITGIYFNVASMSPLGDIPQLRQASKEAALILISSL